MLNTHVYGPDAPGAPVVLAIHGVTGHGARWRRFADDELPGVRVLAPDLRGHARSAWAPPWHLEQHVADLVEVIEGHGGGPVAVIGHSLGGALACRLATARPDLVSALLLLDPAQELDPEMCGTIAAQTIEFFDFTSPEEAKQEKRSGAWAQVPEQVIDDEIAEHLVRRDSGRWEWDISCAAVAALWGELARAAVGAPSSIPTVLLRAERAHFVTDAQLAAMPDGVEVVTVPSDHMVAQEIPAVVGEYARRLIG
ncbi:MULTISPECIES: alpha/beta fold hydrolase [Tsukamurella]|uniref:Alpha/beta fold hydrolase n=2 Tax=Tsukamurella TaxID=2060 RepID=A0A5C5RZA3_9ACTN|nr:MULTISPECIES: alpha/beta fold hydrolase [Tsukamurella]NMD54527.1 alpha/beta fold hydrolase [Tsukamurella columbiensis]TWS28449.1 alpha/beta fold hydrolase [Tsukamurella conjunctivitidis]